MSEKNNDERRDREFDALITWNHRIADAREIEDELLSELSKEEIAALAGGESDFIKQLIAGEFDEELEAPPVDDNKEAVIVTNMEPIGLNRAKVLSEETDDVLDRQRTLLIQQHQKAGQGLTQCVANFDDIDAEKEATQILRDLELWKLPVDPRRIAAEEGIQLLEGEYGDDFDARIEFIPSIQKFAIFHQGVGPGRPLGRVNFSLAHELAHYYLHGEYLLSGGSHNSESDFASKNPMERQADDFAAALLMPRDLFAERVQRLSRQICTLKDICHLSDREFCTSITSTALRYCKCDFEACAVVLSRSGTILWADFSTDMAMLNMRFLRFGSPIPADSWSTEVDVNESGSRTEGVIDADVWFERPYRAELWEEALTLGRTGLTLTFLSLTDPEFE